MCLNVKRLTFRKKARYDIVCYKILSKDEYGNLSSPFFGFDYKLGIQYRGKLGKKTKDNVLVMNKRGKFVIEEGFHTFANIEDAILEAAWRREVLKDRCKIYRCIIPKGGYYYKGTCGYYDAYASSDIIVEQICA